MTCYEVNFDGIVGPTHNYAGLSYGNLASQENVQQESNPKKAALQSLEKMHLLMQLGVKQAVLPPHPRPNILFLRSLGLTGTDEEVIKSAWNRHPEALLAAGSAAAMWTANAATVAPSIDTKDGKTHFTPANLSTKFHRSQESTITKILLKAIFSNPNFFVVHSPIPNTEALSDEGAANHTRFCKRYESKGVHLFVFGNKEQATTRFPARQTFQASQAVALQNQLYKKQTVFAEQNPEAIDAGVFHNDVISVGNERVFLYHEKAFLHEKKVLNEIQKKLGGELCLLKITQEQLPLEDAVATYLFNSQIVTLPNETMAIVAPIECKENLSTKQILENILQDPKNPIQTLLYTDLRQSMKNGGGPACLRLRVVLTEEELKAAHQGVFLNEELYRKLKQWIEAHYRDRMKPRDLADPLLLKESNVALDELTKILQLNSIYPFQK